MRVAETKIRSTRKAAHFYAALGWPIIPIWLMQNGRCACGQDCGKNAGKHPIGLLVPNGIKNASCELAVVNHWWDQYPDANIALATGTASGVFVVDVDPRYGGDETWDELISKNGRVDTVEQETGGGGYHMFFQHVSGLGNSSGLLGAGIDTRGDGGYVILPPSNHIRGQQYTWEVSSHPGEQLLAPIPEWLLDSLQSSQKKLAVTFTNGQMSKPNLERFRLSELIRHTIQQGTNGAVDRSAVEQSVFTALVGAGASNDEILAIFQNYPIGMAGKYAEKGKHGLAYLTHSISQARVFVNQKSTEAAAHSDIAPQIVDKGIANLRPMALADLLAENFSPLVFLVEKLVAKGQLVMLGGRPKSGKSWLVLQLAKCIDIGEAFLGRKTRQAKVLYIAREDGKRRIFERANILKWRPQQTDVSFKMANFDGPRGTLGPGLTQIEQATSKYELIIIDTLIASLSGAANENDNVQMGAISNDLARIAHENEVAIVLVHHTGKGFSDDVFNTLRGASALREAYDVGLLLERTQGEKEAILHAESRDVDVENMTLRQRQNGAGWEYIGDAFEIKKIRSGRMTLEAMREMENSDKGLTAKAIAKHRGVSEVAVYKQLNRLVEDRYVDVLEKPRTEDGKQPNLYYVREGYR